MAADRKKLPKKWLDQISPSASATAAARNVLEARTAAVLYYLPLAAKRAEKNIEYVHQLRVATRRASAAIAALSQVLPPKRARRIDKLLRKIRRACGRARDLDVMIERLQRVEAPQLEPAAKQLLLDELRARRTAVQPDVRRALLHIDSEKLAAQFEKLARKIRWRGDDDEPDWKSAATAVLSREAGRVYEVGKALEGASAYAQRIAEIHRLRIRGKQLRYTMEISVGAFGVPLRELYGFVEEIQRQLGDINDHAVAIDFYRGWETGALLSSARTSIVEIERRGLQTELEQFPRWWNRHKLSEFWLQWQKVVGPLPPASLKPTEVRPRGDVTAKKKGA